MDFGGTAAAAAIHVRNSRRFSDISNLDTHGPRRLGCPAKVRPFTPARQTAMKKILLAVLLAASAATFVVSAQKRVVFDGKVDYVLTVEKQPASAVDAWWPSFVQQNTLEGYCWSLNTLPLVD